MPRFPFSVLAGVVVAVCLASPAGAQAGSRPDVGMSLTVLAPAQVEFPANSTDAGTPTVSGLEQPIVDMIRTRLPAAPAPDGTSTTATDSVGASERRTWIITPNA